MLGGYKQNYVRISLQKYIICFIENTLLFAQKTILANQLRDNHNSSNLYNTRDEFPPVKESRFGHECGNDRVVMENVGNGQEQGSWPTWRELL